MKRLPVALLILPMAVGAALAAAKPLVQQMLPASGAVKGFSIMDKSLTYGKGEDISSIYNGGYEVYTKNGVVDAARQMYVSKNDRVPAIRYVELTVHTMKTDKAAEGFLKYWQKETKAPRITATKTSKSFTVTKPSVMTYSVSGKYFTTAMAMPSTTSAQADAKAFAAAVEKKVLAASKKGK